MEPIIAAALAYVFKKIKWEKLLEDQANEEAKKGLKTLLTYFQPTEREKQTKAVLQLFAKEFLTELADKLDLTAALPGYQDQTKRLLEQASAEITSWLRMDNPEINLNRVRSIWSDLGNDPLPNDFDWPLVAKNYGRALRTYIKSDEKLREQLNTALIEQSTKAITHLAGPNPGFDLPGYRKYLTDRCKLLQLSSLHTSTYKDRIGLWSIFVPQTARESAPIREIPKEILRKLRQEAQLKDQPEPHEDDLTLLRETYQSSPLNPILDILHRERRVVVLGDPGSGKTSLLKYLTLRWTENPTDLPLPLWIDCKEYQHDRISFLPYLAKGATTYKLDAQAVEDKLQSGQAALYLDGLDEIFDGPTRGTVIEELAAFAARYPQAQIVVTSRIIGYEPDRLRNANFTHATLEDFDDSQVATFVQNWHEAAEEDPKERTRLETQLTKALAESRAVRELAGNPLLLTMMAILNRNQELPRDRVELYTQASRVLLHEWDSSRLIPVDSFARQDKEALLRQLAGHMQQREGGLAGNLIERDELQKVFRAFLTQLAIPNAYEKANQLINQLVERNFILCYAGADRFSFVHRTFLEFYCAAYFVERFEKQQTLTLDQLKTEVYGKHWQDETWHEVLRLIAGMVGEKQAEALIQYLMAQDGKHHKLANLFLAAECLGEVRNRQSIPDSDAQLLKLFKEKAIRHDTHHFVFEHHEWLEIGVARGRAVEYIAKFWPTHDTYEWLIVLLNASSSKDLNFRRAIADALFPE